MMRMASSIDGAVRDDTRIMNAVGSLTQQKPPQTLLNFHAVLYHRIFGTLLVKFEIMLRIIARQRAAITQFLYMRLN